MRRLAGFIVEPSFGAALVCKIAADTPVGGQFPGGILVPKHGAVAISMSTKQVIYAA